MSKVNLVNVDTHNERVVKTYSYAMEFFTNMCVFTNYSDVEKLSEDLGIWVPEKIQFVFALRREAIVSVQFNNGSGEDEDLFFVSIASNAGTSLTTGFYSETEALHFFNHIKNWINETERTQHLP